MTNQPWNPTSLDKIYPGSEVAQMTAAIEALGAPVPEPLARAGQLLTIARGVRQGRRRARRRLAAVRLHDADHLR